MGDVLTFRPRPKLQEPAASAPLSGADLREQIEAGAQAALDLADNLIALLDRVDTDPDLEDGGDAEPSLAAPEGQTSQIGWCRGGDHDREADAREEVLPEVACEDRPEAAVLPWRGRGNVISAAGVALLDLVGG